MKPTRPQKYLTTMRFRARLVGTALAFPKSANVKLPGQDAIVVEGMIDCLPFRADLQHDGQKNRSLEASKAMHETLKIADGDMVTIEITRVGDEPEIRVPSDLANALKAIPAARDSWNDITPMARRDWIFSICSAKQPETRERRIEKACDMLRSGKRRLCCFPGIKWMMKENAETCGMWLPLPGSKKR